MSWSKSVSASLVSSALLASAAAFAQTPPGVDHYVCHSTVDSKVPVQPKFPNDLAPELVKAIPFEDQFSTPLLQTTPRYDAKKYKQICVPSGKSHGQEFPILRPTVHLVELQIGVSTKTPAGEPLSQPKFPGTTVRVIDQFRDQMVELLKPVSVLVRSSKSDYGAQVKCKATADCAAAGLPSYLCQPSDKGKICLPPPAGAPPISAAPANDVGADNYTCYQVKAPKLSANVAISFGNQFTAAIASGPPFDGKLRYDLGKMTKLCAPADKAGENPGAETHLGHLACYQAKLSVKDAAGVKIDPKQPKFLKRTVGAQTVNFGARYLDVNKEGEICVPAYKNEVPVGPTPTAPPTATPTPTPTSTAPPTATPTPTPTPPAVGCSTTVVTVTTSYTPPADIDVSGVTTDVSYPGPKLQRSGNPQRLSSQSGIFTFGDSDVNVPGDNFNDLESIGLIAIPGNIPPGDFARQTFNCRAGTPQPTLADFNCVSTVSDFLGLVVPSTCSVSIVVNP